MSELKIIGLKHIGEVNPGDNLAEIILQALTLQSLTFEPGDILVVIQKIVSKSEGQLIKLSDVVPSEFALHLSKESGKDPRHIEVVLREAKRIVKMDRGIMIVETKHGFVCANAGVDHSNIPGGDVLCLLPEDADLSASRIRDEIRRRTGIDLAVIISDTFGRPWRAGIVNIAIGVSGLLPIRSYAGQEDPSGYTLTRASDIAVADELASAAELVMGKIDRIPAAIIRGYAYPKGEGSFKDLVREPEKDLFR
ncbi:MAG: coenzyme F420-0:L-glutamate ligase [Candidatus Tectomicrobia bacterium]|nr:coenzyme F420-0:L-glutamate ligase [Candidatus Tectomicrobia bacterium]